MRAIHAALLYIDPGTGSLLIQALIAGIVAIPIILRDRITRIARSLRRRPPGDRTSPRARPD